MRGRPTNLVTALSLAFGAGLAAAPAAAQVIVAACADVAPAGVEVEGETAFAVQLARDPALASAARIDFTAFDPDNINPDVPDYDGSEVLIRLEPSGYELPDLDGLTWGNFNGRSSSFTAPVPPSALQAGLNQVVFIDMNGSPFAVQRLCVALEDAPPPAAPPASETFCASDVYAPSAIDAQSANDGVPADVSDGAPATIHVEIDVPLTEVAQVGLDVVPFLNGNSDTGNRAVLFTAGEEQLGTIFLAPNVNDHFVVRTDPEPSDLFGEGGEADAPWRVEMTAAADFAGRYWSACFLVQDDFAPPPPDAGPPELDAGEPPEEDAGEPPADAGPEPLQDAGDPDPDGGQRPQADAGSPPGAGPGVVAESDEARLRAQLSDPDLRVSSSCAAAPGGALPGLLALLCSVSLWRVVRRRRAR